MEAKEAQSEKIERNPLTAGRQMKPRRSFSASLLRQLGSWRYGSSLHTANALRRGGPLVCRARCSLGSLSTIRSVHETIGSLSSDWLFLKQFRTCVEKSLDAASLGARATSGIESR